MTYPRTVTARLLNYDGTVILGSPLANSFGVSFYDELNGPGRGQVSLALSDPGSAEIMPGRYVDILVAGTPRFTFKIEGNPDYQIIEEGEEEEQIVTVSGRGWGCVFDEAITYPTYDRNFVLNTSWRLFSFASPDFPNAGGWSPAHEYAEYLEGVDTFSCYLHAQRAPDGLLYPSPIGFPWCTDPLNLIAGAPTANYVDTYWIRPDSMPDWNSTGYYFFRSTFTVTDNPTSLTVTVTGDNFFTLFIEGVPVLGEQINTADHLMWQGWKEQEIFFPAGTYTIAAAVYNISLADLAPGGEATFPPCALEGWAGGVSANNPGGLLCALYVDNGPTVELTHIKSSDASWDGFYDPVTWPGWTPGQIIAKLITEASARGAITVFDSDTFSDSLDSNGDAWRPVVASVDRADIPTFAVEVGSTLLAALQQLNQFGYIDWHVRGGTMILDVWRGRQPGSPSSSATLTAGVNLAAYERNATAPYANALMVQWEGGYTIVEDSAAITAYGTRVEDVYSSDAPSEDEAIMQGENELLRRAQESYPAIVASIEPVSAADCPYEAFDVGDYVTIPGPEVVRVYSINCQQDAEGYAIWTCELNAKLNVPERTSAELLQQIGGRNQVIRGAVT
jgi:hypothetical protein